MYAVPIHTPEPEHVSWSAWVACGDRSESAIVGTCLEDGSRTALIMLFTNKSQRSRNESHIHPIVLTRDDRDDEAMSKEAMLMNVIWGMGSGPVCRKLPG